MHQVAVFTDPQVTSTVTANLEAKNAKGGIHCVLHNAPTPPPVNAVIKNGQWEEVSAAAHESNTGNDFSVSLDGDDEATAKLISQLRSKPQIGELAVYELDTTSNKEQYGYYFHKIMVTHYDVVTDPNSKRMWHLVCKCISFKQKDKNNVEVGLWDSDSNTPKYTGSAK